MRASKDKGKGKDKEMDMSIHRAILEWIEQDLGVSLAEVYTVTQSETLGRSLSHAYLPALWVWITVTFCEEGRAPVTQLFSFDAYEV
jgi:hypothetical protein